MSLNESNIEEAALEWFGKLGHDIGPGPHLAPGGPTTGRVFFGHGMRFGFVRHPA